MIGGMTLLAITRHSGIRLAEVGFALAAVAGGLLFLGAVTPFGRRGGMLFAGLALAAGGVLLVVATRWGGFG
jgi:hypothetical protein